MTPAGPAVCPRTAKRPANDAGRAEYGAEKEGQSQSLHRKSRKNESSYIKTPRFSAAC